MEPWWVIFLPCDYKSDDIIYLFWKRMHAGVSEIREPATLANLSESWIFVRTAAKVLAGYVQLYAVGQIVQRLTMSEY